MTANKGPEQEVVPSFILLYLTSDWKNKFRVLLYLKGAKCLINPEDKVIGATVY